MVFSPLMFLFPLLLPPTLHASTTLEDLSRQPNSVLNPWAGNLGIEQQQPHESVQGRIKAAVEEILSSPPPVGYTPIPPGVRILGVQVEDNKITINLSKELLLEGTGPIMEDAIHQILSPLSDVVPEIKNGDYRILIEGIPLNEYLH